MQFLMSMRRIAAVVVMLAALGGVARADGPLRRGAKGAVHLDVGGEGRHHYAINVNPGNLTSTTGVPGRPIPRLVNGHVEKIPFASGTADGLLVESAPLRPGAAAEIARVLKPGASVRLVHPVDYGRTHHASVITALGGKHKQRVAGDLLITVARKR
jgi:hypothetical protein